MVCVSSTSFESFTLDRIVWGGGRLLKSRASGRIPRFRRGPRRRRGLLEQPRLRRVWVGQPRRGIAGGGRWGPETDGHYFWTHTDNPPNFSVFYNCQSFYNRFINSCRCITDWLRLNFWTSPKARNEKLEKSGCDLEICTMTTGIYPYPGEQSRALLLSPGSPLCVPASTFVYYMDPSSEPLD